VAFSLIDLLQALSAGLLVGSTYALMCIGLGIIFGSMRVINFAQGDFLMLGMYAAFYLTTGFGLLVFLGPYAGPIIAAFLAGPIVFLIGWILHRFIVARVTGAGVAQIEGAGAYGQIIVTLGISLILQNGGLIVFGSTPTGIRTPLSRSSWEIGDVLLNQGRCVSFVVAIALAAAVYLFLSHTRLGKGLRAAADNSQASTSTGRTASPGASGSASPRSPVASSPVRRPSSLMSGSILSSSCMPALCLAASAASSARSGVAC
jgi:branched-chain amino acid transport system permease protein